MMRFRLLGFRFTCLRISSVTRWTPRCWGLRWIFLCSQAGWPTMSPAPTAEVPPEPLLWLAEHAIAGIAETAAAPHPGSMVAAAGGKTRTGARSLGRRRPLGESCCRKWPTRRSVGLGVQPSAPSLLLLLSSLRTPINCKENITMRIPEVDIFLA